MIFHDKYELLALHGGDREIALPGRELSSGRAVLVHLLSDGYTPENLAVLATIDQLSAEYRERVLDKGDHDGIPYVVTEVLPAKRNLREWLAEAKSAPRPPSNPGRSGVWRIPPESGAVKEDALPVSEAGEFTRFFQAMKEPEPVRSAPPKPDDLPTMAMPAPMLAPRLEQLEPAQLASASGIEAAIPAVAAPAPVRDVEPEVGEFTRMLRSAAPPAPATPPTATPAVPEPEAGEFTRMLRSAAPPAPSAPVTPPATTPAAPVEPEAGEFTRMLRAATPAAQAAAPAANEPGPSLEPPVAPAPAAPPVVTPSPAKPVTQPGQFTRILVSPSAPPVVLPNSRVQPPAADAKPPAPDQAQPGEFTRMFQAPTPAAPTAKTPPAAPSPSPSAAAPGEFTRMMQSPLAPEPLPSQPPAPPAKSASEFTRMMQAGQLTDAPAFPKPSAAPPASPSLRIPGEFTRMFAAEAQPSESLVAPVAPQAPLPQGGMATGAFSRRAASPPPSVPSGPSEFTQMFKAPPPAAAPAPAPKATPPAPKAEKSPLTLILVLAGLLLLVVIVIVVFALAR